MKGDKGDKGVYLPVSSVSAQPDHPPRDRRLIAFRALAAAACLYLSIDTYYALTERFSSVKHDPFHWKGCSDDPHYLCGYLTVPLDYTNSSDHRTAEIATVLYQQRPGHKTEKTLVIEPGGPGGSGTSMLWAKGKTFGEMYTDGQYDVLGFDPRAYAQMFPDRVGRLALDGMEFVKDGWQPWGWGTTSLDNVTNAFEDGIIGECVKAGPEQCALATEAVLDESHYLTLHVDLAERLHKLFYGLIDRPIPGYSSHGPGIVTYEYLTSWLYSILYHPADWKASAEILASLEKGNATSALEAINDGLWQYKPGKAGKDPNSGELESMVICGDAYDAEHKSLDWWKDLHDDMIEKSWISGTPRLYATLPCRHFKWEATEVYRGNFSQTLRNPLLLIGGPYDPATPLRNARRLAEEMGDNARLIVHHGYGHSSARDPSTCTQERVRAFMLNGTLPEKSEVDCYADSKPFDNGFWGLQ